MEIVEEIRRQVLRKKNEYWNPRRDGRQGRKDVKDGRMTRKEGRQGRRGRSQRRGLEYWKER
jgi:hypothetical protein